MHLFCVQIVVQYPISIIYSTPPHTHTHTHTPVWGIDKQNTFKFTNEIQSTASGVLDKIIEKKRPFFEIFLTEPEETSCLEHL